MDPKKDKEHGAEVQPPNETTGVEVREVDQELDYDRGAKLDSEELHQSEVSAPERSEVIPPDREA